MEIKGQKITGTAVSLAVLAGMGGFIFGYDTGQISGIVTMDDFKRRFADCPDLNDLAGCTFNVWREGLIVAMLSVGTAIGALIGAPTADYFGRRWAISLECIVFCLGVLVQVTAFNAWEQVMMGRWISGLGVGALSAAVPLFQAETAPKQLRGTLTGLYQLQITFGILVAACINLGTATLVTSSASWRIPIGVGIAFAAILAVGIHFLPESPRWLEQRGEPEKAKHAVARLHAVKNIENDRGASRDYQEIEAAVVLSAKMRKATWLDCFKPENKTLYRTILGITLQMLQQLTGANYFFYYGASLFQGIGITNAYATQIILNAVNFVCTFFGLYVMERFGRRMPLIVGGLWQGAWLLVFASVGSTRDPTVDEGAAKIMIVSGCLFIFGYASTWAPGVWILIGETFPTRTRAKQGAISTFSNWTWNFLIAFFTQPITANIGFRYGYIFAASNIAGAVFVWFFLYESSGLSLEAVDSMYRDKNVKPWTSKNYIPEGYSSRYQRDDTSDDQLTMVGTTDVKNRDGLLQKEHAKAPTHTENA